MSLYGNPDKAQNSKIASIKQEAITSEAAITALEVDVATKLTADGGTFIVPTSDPAVAGALWNSAGTLTISAG